MIELKEHNFYSFKQGLFFKFKIKNILFFIDLKISSSIFVGENS